MPSDSENQLIAGLEAGSLKGIKKALKAGADINGKDNTGRPFVFSARYDAYLIWKKLFKLGLDPNIRDAAGESLLERHAQSAYILSEIIAAGVDLKACGPAAVRAVIRAESYDVDETLQVFPDWLFNIPDSEGHTALQYALNSNKRDAAVFLARHSAELEHLNHAHESALTLAKKNIPELAETIQKEIVERREDKTFHAARQNENLWRRNFLRPGFIFDAAFSIAALVLTPLILKSTEAAKTGHGEAEFGSLLLIATAIEALALTLVLPRVFREHRGSNMGFMSLLLLWLAHFALQMILTDAVILRSLRWQDASTQAQYLTIFLVTKEFYLAGLLTFCVVTARRLAKVSHPVVIFGQFLLACTAFLFYTIAFEGMSHAEVLEGIDPNIADYFAYKVFHFTFIFLLIYFPARLAFVIEDKLAVFTQGDRWLYRAGLILAIIGGTWGLYTGPDVTPADATAREERFGQSRLMEHIHYAPLGYLKRLIAAGVDVNARDNEGRTALHKAVYHGRTGAIRLLLENKADSNIQMNTGKTALHLIFRQGWSGLAVRLEMTEMLLKAGADPNIRNKAGRNFIESVENGYKDYVRPFLKHSF